MMLANFFNKSKPVNYLVLLILFLVEFSMISFRLFSEEIPLGNYLTTRLLFLIDFLFLFTLFSFIVSKNKLVFEHSYASFFFVIFFGLFPKTLIHFNDIYINIILFLFFRKLYSLRKSSSLLKKLFDAGFWLGIAFILSPYTLFFLGLLYVGILIHQKITLQTILTPIIGFITPLFLFFTYWFWKEDVTRFTTLFSFEIPAQVNLYFQKDFLYPLLLLLIFSIISIFLKSPKALSVSNTFKRSWTLLLVHFFVAIAFFFSAIGKTTSEVLVLFFPAAIIMANGLETIANKWIRESILWLFLLSSLVTIFII